MPRLFSLFGLLDWSLLIGVLTLTSIGLLAIYGIGISQEPAQLFPFYKQLVAAGIGLIIMTTLTIIDYRHIRSLSVLLYLAGAALLLLVAVFGQTVNGTRGWFHIAGLSFQPVEISKLTLTAYLAALIARVGRSQLSWRLFGLSGAATAIYVALVMLQPDFGSAMVMCATWGVLCMFKGLPKRAWIILPMVLVLSGSLMWSFGLKPYQKARINTFLHPTHDVRGSSYNATQARIAIGSGGLFGKGIGEGSQARLRFLPEAKTDFMFAVLGEEWGFMGVAVILGVFGLILWRYVTIAQHSGDEFAALLLIGLGAILFVHVTVNTGMNLGLMPVTGIPLPFLSAAASYMTVTFISVGCAESVAIRRRGSNGT